MMARLVPQVERVHAQFSRHVWDSASSCWRWPSLMGVHTAGLWTVGQRSDAGHPRVGSTLNTCAFGDDAERTEAATPRRREQAREEGQAVKSREVVITAVFLSNVLFFSFAGRSLYEHMLTLTREAFVTLGDVEFSTRWDAAPVHALSSTISPPCCYRCSSTTFALTVRMPSAADRISFSLNSLAPQWSTHQSGTRFAA